jgi:hypothetical protein
VIYVIYERRFGVVDENAWSRSACHEGLCKERSCSYSLTSALDVCNWSASHPVALHPVKGHHYTVNRIGRHKSRPEEYFLSLPKWFMYQLIHRNERYGAKIWISQAGKSKSIHRFVNTKQNLMKDDAAVYCKKKCKYTYSWWCKCATCALTQDPRIETCRPAMKPVIYICCIWLVVNILLIQDI